MELNSKGCFDFIARSIQACFEPLKHAERHRIKEIKERRIKFADSELVKIWCDCSDNFEHGKLKKMIIDYNNNLMYNLKVNNNRN